MFQSGTPQTPSGWGWSSTMATVLFHFQQLFSSRRKDPFGAIPHRFIQRVGLSCGSKNSPVYHSTCDRTWNFHTKINLFLRELVDISFGKWNCYSRIYIRWKRFSIRTEWKKLSCHCFLKQPRICEVLCDGKVGCNILL